MNFKDPGTQPEILYFLQRTISGDGDAFLLHIRSGSTVTSWELSGVLTTNPSEVIIAEPQKSHTDEFINFEGRIGESIVYLWDRGTLDASAPNSDSPNIHQIEQGLSSGELNLVFKGVKLRGGFRMFRKNSHSSKWSVCKIADRFATIGNQFQFSDDSVKSDKAFSPEDLTNPEHLELWENKGIDRYQSKNNNTITRNIGFIPIDKKQREASFFTAVATKNIKLNFSKTEKIIYLKKHISKADLLAYYYFISPVILPYLKDRPLISRRYPNGISEPAATSASGGRLPPWIRTMNVFTGSGAEKKSFILTDNDKTLLYLTNHSAVEHFTWSSSAGTLNEPDFGSIAIIPSKCPAKQMITAAMAVKQSLEDFGLYPVCKTTGKGYGLEVYFPITFNRNYDDLNQFCTWFVEFMQAKLGSFIALTAEDSLGRVWLRADMNKKSKPFVAPYSLRAIEWAGVSAPLEWSELQSSYKPLAYNFDTIFERLQKIGDPFAPLLNEQGDLYTATEKLMAARAKLGMTAKVEQTG